MKLYLDCLSLPDQAEIAPRAFRPIVEIAGEKHPRQTGDAPERLRLGGLYLERQVRRHGSVIAYPASTSVPDMHCPPQPMGEVRRGSEP